MQRSEPSVLRFDRAGRFADQGTRGLERPYGEIGEKTKADPVSGPKDPKDKCWDDYVECLNGPIGSMMSNQFGYSQCQVCQEQCIQDGGIWPVLARNNKPCR